MELSINNEKKMTMPLALVLSVVIAVVSITTTAFIMKATQDNMITIATQVNNTQDKKIVEIEDVLKTFDKSEVAIMKSDLSNMKQSLAEIKSDLDSRNKQQEKFYRKMAAKLGFTFDE